MVNIWLLYVVVNMWLIREKKKTSVGMMTFPIYGQTKFMFETNQTYVCWFPAMKYLNITDESS
jgi:hypothetical protein